MSNIVKKIDFLNPVFFCLLGFVVLLIIFLIPQTASASSFSDNNWGVSRVPETACNALISDSITFSDEPWRVLVSVTMGGTTVFDDVGSNAFSTGGGYTVNRCGCDGGCTQTDSFDWISANLGAPPHTVTVSGSAQNKGTNAPGGVGFSFGVQAFWNDCASGQIVEDGVCVPVSGSINATCPGSCTAPANVSASWNSNGLASWAFINDTSWAQTGQSGNGSITLSAGTYDFCLKAQDGYETWWPISGYLVCDTVTVNAPSPPPTVDIKANGSDGPITIPYNTSATLSWVPTDSTSCTASNAWSGSKNASGGSQSTGPLTTGSYTYTIVCSGPGGSSPPDSVTVNVSAPPGATAELYVRISGTLPWQKSVTVNTGQNVDYRWLSSNGINWGSTYSASPADDPCGPGSSGGPWSANNSGQTLSNQTVASCQAGHTYTLTYQVWAPVAYVPNYAEDSVTVTVNPASCSNSISPTSRSHGAGAETGTVGVTAGAGCSWTASESLSWVSITAGSSGTGNGTVNYSVSSNSGGARSGTITIASQTFTVNQAGAACSYSISPTSASVSSAAGSGSVSVTAGAGCAWTSTSNDSWITRTGGASGSGNGTVTYSYTSNGGSARTGTLTIADQTFSLSQAGVVASPVLFVSPTFFSFIAPQGGPNPAAQALTITNIGPGGTMLNWTLSVSTATGGPWLSSSRSSGAESGGGGTATPAPSISVNVSGLAVGTYNGTISISSNGGSASIPVTLNISNAADFSISASPPSQNATVGILNVFYFDLTVTPSGGFASPVTLTRNTSGPCISAGLPCGSSTNFFSSSPVNPNDPAPQSTYEIWITPTTPGIYTITFTGTSGALTHSYNVALIVDPAPVCIAAGSGTGLTGSYYGSRMGAQDYSNWVRSQTDSQVNFNWGTGSPSGLGPNNYSVLWEGTVVPRCNETYTFYANADDGVTLTVNGSTIINSWTDSPGERTSSGVALTAGQSYTIRMQYYEHTGSAFAELRWSSASTPKALVATSQLFPRTCVNRALVSGSAAAGPISVGGTYPLSCNYGQITNSITAFSDATACPVNSPPFSGTTANFTCPAGSIAPRNAVNTCRLTFLPPDYFCAATSGVNSTQIVANPPDLVLEFVSSACVSNNSQITLRYRTTGTVQASTIQVYRDGALIFTDIAAPAPGVWKNWTNTGLTFNQSYSYTARSTLSGFNGTMSGAVAAVAPNCNPTPNVSVSISAITGTGCSLPSGVKNGCILTFRVLYQNVGGGPASSVLSMNDLSQNLIYQSGSLSCTISCSVLSATAGNVTFQTNVSLAAGAQFFASFNAQVQTSSAASRELANVRTHGQYNPGPAAFDVTYSLITSPSLVITPKIYEVAP